MKRYLIIGLGHFGSWAAHSLHEQGHEVIGIDRDPALVDRYADELTRGVVGDAANRELLERVGAAKADAAVISTGEDLAASILATQALRDLGLTSIYIKVTSRAAARAMEVFGVTETIFPEREAAYRLAHRIASTTVLDYVPLAEGYSIQEIAIPDDWLGKSLRELDLPERHGIQVVALHDLLDGELHVVPSPDTRLTESNIAIVAGKDETISRLLGRR